MVENRDTIILFFIQVKNSGFFTAFIKLSKVALSGIIFNEVDKSLSEGRKDIVIIFIIGYKK